MKTIKHCAVEDTILISKMEKKLNTLKSTFDIVKYFKNFKTKSCLVDKSMGLCQVQRYLEADSLSPSTGHD